MIWRLGLNTNCYRNNYCPCIAYRLVKVLSRNLYSMLPVCTDLM